MLANTTISTTDIFCLDFFASADGYLGEILRVRICDYSRGCEVLRSLDDGYSLCTAG